MICGEPSSVLIGRGRNGNLHLGLTVDDLLKGAAERAVAIGESTLMGGIAPRMTRQLCAGKERSRAGTVILFSELSRQRNFR